MIRALGVWRCGAVLLTGALGLACSSPAPQSGIDAKTAGAAAAGATAADATTADATAARAAAEAATGSAALPAQPSPPRGPDLTLEDRAAWRALVHWPEECEAAFEQSHAGTAAGLEFHALSEGLTLLGVVCAAGSYQPSSVFLRVDERVSPPSAAMLTFATYESDNGESLTRTQETEVWGETAFLAEDKALVVLRVSRQSGDCGTWARYEMDGAAPRLTELWARFPCPAEPEAHVNPQPGHPPEEWKRVRID